MNSADPKFRKWATIQKEFKKLEDEEFINISRRGDTSLCLTHGFHYQNSYMCKDVIRCSAYRSNAVTEEFIINYGHGTGNVIEIKSFKKDSLKYDGDDVRPATEQSVIQLSTPPIQHIVFLHKHRLFVGLGNDKNLRVYSDVVNRCRALSAPTVCAMPVLCMAYLEETDEVITAGIGVIQPWRIRFSTDMNLDHGQSEDTEGTDKKKAKPDSSHGGMPKTVHRDFGQGRQMLQPCDPYRCDVMKDEWVMKLRVYNDKKNKYSITEGCKTVLVATSAEVIVAIDYIKRRQLWSARLLSTYSIVTEMERMDKDVTGEPKAKPPDPNYIIRGHVSLTACDFFPRFGYLITGGIEGMIQVLHMVNFRSVATLIGHRLAITGVVAHTRYAMVITSSVDKSIRIWCLETFRENQRIDTVHRIQSISLSESRRFLFYYTKKRIGMYYFHNHYSLYSIPHSTAASLCPVRGDYSHDKHGKILAALADGSVALLSPSTGMMVTMIYPMTTFQIYNDMVFDIYSKLCYMRLQDGSILQSDCTTNPSTPFQCLVPSMAYDEDVCSISAVRVVNTSANMAVTVVIAGLRNGQIVLVRPNDYWMANAQAHESEVRFLKVVSDAMPIEEEDDYSCRDMLFSVSSHSVRVWQIVVGDLSELPEDNKNALHHGKIATKLFQLQPLNKLFLPAQALRPKLVAVLHDRVCAVGEDDHITVVIAEDRRQSRYYRFADDHFMEKFQHLDDAKRASLKTEQSHFFSQNPEDRHAGLIMALTSSPTLRFFASSGDDGLVKIWDEKNRLLRELSFLPNSIKAICFVNDRDLLVSLDGRIMAVECSTFLTRQIIVDRGISDLYFDELPCEDAHPYDDNVSVVSTVGLLGTAPLCANQRTRVDDDTMIMRARKLIRRQTDEIRRSSEALSRTRSSHLDQYIRGLETAMNDSRKMTTEQRASRFAIVGEGRREAYKRMSSKIRRKSTASLFDEEEAANTIINREKVTQAPHDSDLPHFEGGEKVAKSDANTTEKGDSNQGKPEDTKPAEILSSGDHIKLATQARFVIPSYGYVPNSVVRKKSKPPSPPPDVQAKWWKPLPVTTEHWFKWDNFDDDTVWMPDQYSSDSESGHSEHTGMMTGYFAEDSSNYALLQQYYAEQEDELLTAEQKHGRGRFRGSTAYSISFDEETPGKYADALKMFQSMTKKEREQYEKYMEQKKGHRLSAKRLSFRKLGNTLLGNEPAVVTNRSRKERVLKFRPVERAIYGVSDYEKGSVDQSDATSELSPSASKSDIEEREPAAEVQANQEPPKRPSLQLTKSDMKARLLQERSDAKLAQSKPQTAAHPLLQKISTSPWFRRKLSTVTPQTVANALLEVGNTTRTVGQQKACSDLTTLVREFSPPCGKTVADPGEFLNQETIDQINVFIASYLNPRYSSSGISSATSMATEHDAKKNINRVQLAHNALECVENGIGMSKEIELGIIRLAADEDVGLRERAMRLLKERLNINSFDELTERLEVILDRPLVLQVESSIKFEGDALGYALQKIKQGAFTLANAPKMAERLKIVITKRRISGQDDQHNTDSEIDDSPHTAPNSSPVKSEENTFEEAEVDGNDPDETSPKPDSECSQNGEDWSGRTTASRDILTEITTNRSSVNRLSIIESPELIFDDTNQTMSPSNTDNNIDVQVEPKRKESIPPAPKKLPKINWKRAVPNSSKQTIRTMRTVRFVNRLARLQSIAMRSQDRQSYSDDPTSHEWRTSGDTKFGSTAVTDSATRIDSASDMTIRPKFGEAAQESGSEWRSKLQMLKECRGGKQIGSNTTDTNDIVQIDSSGTSHLTRQSVSDPMIAMDYDNHQYHSKDLIHPCTNQIGDKRPKNYPNQKKRSNITANYPLWEIGKLQGNRQSVKTRFINTDNTSQQWERDFSGLKRYHNNQRQPQEHVIQEEEAKSIQNYPISVKQSLSQDQQSVIRNGVDLSVPAPPPSVMHKSTYWESHWIRKYMFEQRRTKLSLYQIKSKSFKKLIRSAQKHYKEIREMHQQKEASAQDTTSLSIRLPSVGSSFSGLRKVFE